MHTVDELISYPRDTRYDRGILPVRRVKDITVISVGNIRAGGSGKTPLAVHLAGYFRDRGEKTAILSRGYRGTMEGRGGMVSRGDGPMVTAREAGDEAFATARGVKDVIVRVGADRLEQARAAKRDGAKIVILDDGFQHRRLHRDLDIVSVCPQDLDPGEGFLPRGPLREGADALRRAHLLVGIESDWKDHDDPPAVLMEYVPRGLASFSDEFPLDHLDGKRVHLMSGIARPHRFLLTAKRARMNITGESSFADHHRYSAEEIRHVVSAARSQGANAILTTCKDLARLNGMESDLPIFALQIMMDIVKGADVLQSHLRQHNFVQRTNR
jgi:tetraacyldisaccharide 4'-kinase